MRESRGLRTCDCACLSEWASCKRWRPRGEDCYLLLLQDRSGDVFSKENSGMKSSLLPLSFEGERGSVTPPMQSISLTLPAHCHCHCHPPLQSRSQRLLFISLQGSFVLSAVRNLIVVWRRGKNGNGDIRNSRRTKTIIARHDDKTPSNRQSDHTAF